jgi:hypothetical protein
MDEHGSDSRSHDHGTRQKRGAGDADSAFAASKSSMLSTSRNHYYELEHIVAEARTKPELERRMKILDDAYLACKRQLPAAVGGGSARPTHTSADKQRKQRKQKRRKSPPPPMRGSVRAPQQAPPPRLSSLRAPQEAPRAAAPPPPSRHVEDVPERNIHFNVMTQQNEYRSDENDNMSSSSDDSPPPPPPPQRRNRMYLVDGGTWMIEPGSQPGP